MNNEANNTPTPITNQTTEMKQKVKEGVIGPIIGTIIILLIVILGGLYYFRYLKENSPVMKNGGQNRAEEVKAIDEIEKQVNNNDLDAVDNDLKSIDKELDEALAQ